MKRALALLALGMFITSGVVGCEASAKVGDDSPSGTSTSYKKTTTVTPSGEKEVKTTEVKRID